MELKSKKLCLPNHNKLNTCLTEIKQSQVHTTIILLSHLSWKREMKYKQVGSETYF